MKKPTSMSVTDVPCSCGYLATSVADANTPIGFSEEFNEFFFEHTLAAGTKVLLNIYHCPMCGGVASNSSRDKFFVEVPEDELLRLEKLLSALHTVEDILGVLGTPDEENLFDIPPDIVRFEPQTRSREHGPIRALTYTRLSEVADVHFEVYSNGKIQRMIGGKFRADP
jgi:hypothetical protein